MVNSPTRVDNTLELSLTNNPSIVNRTSTCPGISDHEAAVFFDCDIKPKKNKQDTWNVPLYKKADWEGLTNHLRDYRDTLTHLNSDTTTTNNLRESFKTTLENGIQKYIPHRQSGSKDDPPWVSRELISMVRKRDRLEKKKFRTKNPTHINEF